MDTKKNIILIGFMGCGKSTFGRRLSKRLGMDFVDTDKYIEMRENMSISNIFALKGEDFFRSLENKLCRELSLSGGKVIATGGGIIKNAENIKTLSKSGIIVYLKAAPEHIYRNVANDNSRPLLEGPDKMGRIISLLNERKPLYEKYADVAVSVSGDTVKNITEKIITVLEGKI